ncbi:helix-turn-helix transcriptional regulator [Paraburkholderia domus]|uniref:helix-turn-helix transcriptional regulator n=1 Tax=Paraburkholderia domus TaxID=2793075 RepID=UPI00191480CC|nr:helix-turn-helix transcriptional regulator [Paraburkholderia domus]MBK5065911.1 helix-turn-helix transcriptional regulator [Burkholderia sp. R-70199]CAE6959370.1 hypothetical protein R70199_07198 [Paraburkholderia domus]
MRYWKADNFVANEPNARVMRELVNVIGGDDQSEFSEAVLASLDGVVGAEHCMIFRYPENGLIELVSGAGDHDRLLGFENARPYMAKRLYRLDSNRQLLTDEKLALPGNSMLHHQTLEDVTLADHRALYSHARIAERVSILHCLPDRTWVAINLYRGAAHGSFSANELAHLSGTACAITQAVTRHVALRKSFNSTGTASFRSAAELSEEIVHRYPDFPRREREVMSGLLRGLTFDGVACELGVSFATVVTYKQRLFARLNIHTRPQLFAAFFGAGAH